MSLRVARFGVLLAACGCGSDPGLPLGQLGQPIVGGEPSSDAQNFSVLIARAGFKSWCSGAVVAPQLVLTARHCLYETLLGTNDISTCGDERVQDTQVERAWPPESFTIFVGKEHPLPAAVARGTRIYSGSDLDICENDVALLQVDTPLPVEPLPLRLDAPPNVGEEATLIGWGATQDGQGMADVRQQRSVVVEAVGPANYAPEGGPARALRASDFASTVGGCAGDSGAPLVSQASGAIIGVQGGVSSIDPEHDLDPAQGITACFDSITLFGRIDLQADWLRSAFRSSEAAPWLEGHPRPADPGQSCAGPDDCLSGLCVSAGASSFCSVHCESTPCPAGMSCVGPNADQVCVPEAPVAAESGRASGCALSPSNDNALWLFPLLWLLRRPWTRRRFERR